MATIEAGNGVVTHINVFTVLPERQDALVASLTETVKAAKTVPGWLSASIHKSYDGRQVTNYIQFESQDAAQSTMRYLASGGFIQRNVAIAESVALGQYEVVFTIVAD